MRNNLPLGINGEKMAVDHSCYNATCFGLCRKKIMQAFCKCRLIYCTDYSNVILYGTDIHNIYIYTVKPVLSGPCIKRNLS
jgi:hypothetical protein